MRWEVPNSISCYIQHTQYATSVGDMEAVGKTGDIAETDGKRDRCCGPATDALGQPGRASQGR